MNTRPVIATSLGFLLFAAGCKKDEEAPPPPDADGDGFADDKDCAPDDASIHPDAEEICDEIDNNCNEVVDEGLNQTWWADYDFDGYGDPDRTIARCDQPTGHVANEDDCDDDNAEVFPDAPELCDGIDNDCNDLIDDDVPKGAFCRFELPGAAHATFDGEGGGQYAGSEVGRGGDVDGDGFDDLLIAAEIYPDSKTWTGAVYVVRGSPKAGNHSLADADGKIVGADIGDSLGSGGLATAGDLNGDGYDDIAMGTFNAALDPGELIVVYGPVDGVVDLAKEGPDLAITNAATLGFFESQPEVDLDGDKVVDLIVGAADAGAKGEGLVHILPGDLTGVQDASAVGVSITGDVGKGLLGFDTAMAGDVDGDGVDDIVTAAYGAATVYVIPGDVAADSSVGAISLTEVTAGANSEFLGYSVAGLGDVDGDGYADFAIGDPLDTTSGAGAKGAPGAVFLVRGPAAGGITADAADGAIFGEGSDDLFGIDLATADYNGDGTSDLLVQGWWGNDYLGGAWAIPGDFTGTGEPGDFHQFVGEAQDSMYYGAISSAGDVDDDGADDVLIGAPYANGQAGVSYLILGSLL